MGNLRASSFDVLFCFIWGGGDAGADREGGGRVCAGSSSLENLHAIVASVSHHDAPVAVDGNAATRKHELPVA